MKTAIYTRVSKSETHQTVERQRVQLLEYCKASGYEVVADISENVSGRITNRRGTVELIELAKQRKINKVIIHEVSRLGRNLADAVNTMEKLKNYKVSIYDFKTGNETLDDKGNYTTFGLLALPMLAGIAEQFLSDHVYRIKSGLELARKKGVKLGRPKKEKYKKQDEILSLLSQGFIITDIGKKIKASNRNIAKYLGVAVGTVVKVRSKFR